jgi:hypothetical protein
MIDTFYNMIQKSQQFLKDDAGVLMTDFGMRNNDRTVSVEVEICAQNGGLHSIGLSLKK